MGHQYPDPLPRTPRFKRVISLLGNSAGGGGIAGVAPGTLEEVTVATLEASDNGLEKAKNDEGVSYCLYLMAQLTRAATMPDFGEALAELGIPGPRTSAMVPDYASAPASAAEFTVFDLVSGFTSRVDQHLAENLSRTDIGEMAQLAAAESLISLCGNRPTLFETSEQSVQESLRKLASERGFSKLSHEFFSGFLRRYLEYHLSRELSNHVGPGRRFSGAGEHNQFLDQLDDHCRAKSSIVRQFAGEWYGKHRFHDDITPRKTKYFAAHAIDKIRYAMSHGEERDDG